MAEILETMWKKKAGSIALVAIIIGAFQLVGQAIDALAAKDGGKHELLTEQVCENVNKIEVTHNAQTRALVDILETQRNQTRALQEITVTLVKIQADLERD